jgi:hypothetical protein
VGSNNNWIIESGKSEPDRISLDVRIGIRSMRLPKELAKVLNIDPDSVSSAKVDCIMFTWRNWGIEYRISIRVNSQLNPNELVGAQIFRGEPEDANSNTYAIEVATNRQHLDAQSLYFTLEELAAWINNNQSNIGLIAPGGSGRISFRDIAAGDIDSGVMVESIVSTVSHQLALSAVDDYSALFGLEIGEIREVARMVTEALSAQVGKVIKASHRLRKDVDTEYG